MITKQTISRIVCLIFLIILTGVAPIFIGALLCGAKLVGGTGMCSIEVAWITGAISIVSFIFFTLVMVRISSWYDGLPDDEPSRRKRA